MERGLTIHENAQGALAGVSVGVGNLWEREYEPKDGGVTRAMTAMLFVGDADRVVVGVGSVVEIGGRQWRVDAVDKPAGGKGSVRIVEAL